MRAAISVALFLMLGASAQSQANSAVQNNSSVTSGGAGIALLQSASWDASDSNWATLQFSANNTAGNFIAVVIQGGASGEAFTVTDTQGNSYQQAIQTNEDNARETIAIYYATNIAGGANTVTLTQTILGSFRFAILEYSGVAKTNALDVAAAAQGSSALPSSGTVTTTANGDLLLGGILTAGGESYTPGAGYAIAESEPAEPGTKMIAEYQTPATAGGNSASALLGSTDFWAADLAAFKSAASGGAATPPTTPTPPPPSTPPPPPPPPLPTIPAITNLNPTSGTAGTLVTITGTNFGSSMGTVAFNGIEVTPTNWSSTSITAAVPSGATTGNVVVTVGGVASNGVNFNIVTSKGAGIALVQSTGTDASNSSSNALAFGANNTAGNFIAVVIQGGQSGEAFTVTDSQGDTYQQAIQTNEDNARETIAIYYATNIAGGANTVYIFQSVLGSFRIAILEYSGVAKTNALDVAAAAQGASAFPNSGSVTTTASGDLLLGGVMSAGGEFYTASSGYRIEQNVSASPNTRMIAEDQIQASAGPNSAGASLGTTDFWAAVVAAFRPAGGTSSAGSSSGSGGSTPPAQGRLSASTANLNFGNISVGTSGLLTDMLSNSGTANVTISNVSISGAGIGTSGVSAGLVLAPGQSAPLNVAFAPTAAVGVSGSVTVSSNAANSPMSITISGAGVEQTSHSADLSWSASSGAVGYNVYRGTVSGGPYALLPGSPITLTTFTDMNVQAGQSYFYAVTSLNSNGVESALSNQAAAKIP